MELLHELLNRLYEVASRIRWGGLAMICPIIFTDGRLVVVHSAGAYRGYAGAS